MNGRIKTLRAMKKYIYIISAAAVCMLAACAKEFTEPKESAVLNKGELTYIQAGLETRATLDDKHANTDTSFKWSTGDQIAIYAGEYLKSAGLDSKYNGSPTASFGFEGLVDADRADFAVYPAHLVFDGDEVIGKCKRFHSAASLTLNLPESYNYGEVSGYRSPVPMIGLNAPGQGIAFKALCPVIRITLRNIPKDCYYITLDFNGKKVQGQFSLTDVDLENIASFPGLQTEATDDVDDIITIQTPNISAYISSTVLTLPVPSGEYDYVTVSTYDMTDHVISAISVYLKKDTDGKPLTWAPTRKTSKKLAADLPCFLVNNVSRQKVVFAPGNLVATLTKKPTGDADKVGTCNDFRFAEHQYDALGDSEGNTFAKTSVPIDLFTWIGQSAQYEFTSDDEHWGIIWPNNTADADIGNLFPEKIKWDWGINFNGKTYPEGTWRIPDRNLAATDAQPDVAGSSTVSEWSRLISSRQGPYVSCKNTLIQPNPDPQVPADTIAHGLIVFPDNFTMPYGVKELVKYGKAQQTGSSVHYNENIITLEEWEILEKFGGCVYLPVTNVRTRNSGAKCLFTSDATYWSNNGNSAQHAQALCCSDGYLATNSCNGQTSTTPKVASTSIQDGKSVGRKNGAAVRLIREIN